MMPKGTFPNPVNYGNDEAYFQSVSSYDDKIAEGYTNFGNLQLEQQEMYH